MKCFFTNPDFDYQLVRLLDSTKNLGADLSECLNTSMQIEEGNVESWYAQWMNLGSAIKNDGILQLKQGHLASAAASFLRASNYFRQAYAFLYFENIDDKILKAYELQKECFAKSGIYFKELQIPYQDQSYLAHFYPAPHRGKAPLIIINQGYEGNQLDSFFSYHHVCQTHGYHLLTFDGPGQGEQLIYKQLKMPLEWQDVITPLIDRILRFPEIDQSRISLVGMGWGGFLGAKAAAYERRISSLILAPGIFDPLVGMERVVPDIRKLLRENETTAINLTLGQAMSNKLFANKLKVKMLAHGVDSPSALLKLYLEGSLHEAKLIRCPTLVFDCQGDPLYNNQAKMVYDQIGPIYKSYHTCQDWNSLTSSHHQSLIFDWIDEVKPVI